MNFEVTAQIMAISAVAGAAFHFAVLRPLQDTINELRDLIRETREDNRAQAAQIKDLQITTARIDERITNIERDVGHV